MIIYKSTNKINGKEYIGQTVNSLEKRISSHKASKKETYFSHALKKYGNENFEWEVLKECNSKEELDKMEIFYIKELNTFKPNGYNLTLGGDAGTLGWKPTIENKKNISDGNKKYWNEKKKDKEFMLKWSEITRERMLKNNPMKGKERLDMKGDLNFAKRPEVRNKISRAAKNRDRFDLIGENNPSKREEVRNKISKKLKGRKITWEVGRYKRTEEYKNKLSKSKSIYTYNVISPIGEEFIIYGLGKFAKDNNLNKSGIRYHIKNNTDTYKGWKFQRVG